MSESTNNVLEWISLIIVCLAAVVLIILYIIYIRCYGNIEEKKYELN